MLHREMLIDGHFIGGPCDQGVGKAVVRSPWNGQVIGTAAEGGWSEANAALRAAEEAFHNQNFPAEARNPFLGRVADRLIHERDFLAELMADEIGKPIALGKAEIDRASRTFRIAQEYCKDPQPEPVSISEDPRSESCIAYTLRVPVGPIFCITPYNWPINLLAHKVAPALAVGCPVLLKPSPLSPLTSLSIIRILHEEGCPPGWINAVMVEPPVAEKIATDPRIKMLSFTGSPQVGWHLKKLCWDKPVVLELGGNASCVVMTPHCSNQMVDKIVASAFGYAGQVCISTQHLWVSESVYPEFRSQLIDAVEQVQCGDPRNPDVLCGPMIHSDQVDRVVEWVTEARREGAVLLTKLHREGNLLHPIVLENVPPQCQIAREEVFAPVVTLRSIPNLKEAMAHVQRGSGRIHTALWSDSQSEQEQFVSAMDSGGVILNETPSLRFDRLPYGGTGASGSGREGVLASCFEMTRWKSVIKSAK